MQFDDKLGCQLLQDALKYKDSIQRTITRSSIRSRTRLKQLSDVTKRQIKEIELMRRDTHPFFLPTDYDKDGHIKDCMSVVERTTPGVRFSAFEKHAGYLSQLSELGYAIDDTDGVSNRNLPAETYTQAMRMGQLSTLDEDVIISKSSLPFLSVAADSGYILTRRICSPLISVRDIRLTSSTQDSDIWKHKPVSCATTTTISPSQCAARLSALDVILY